MRLVLTPTYNSCTNLDKKTIYLGDWCALHQDTKSRNLDHEIQVVDYHWWDRKKIQRDYKYLDVIYEKLLCDVSSQLNKIHGTNHPLMFWRIVIGPWLLTYVSVIWDRIENIRTACASFDIDEIVSCDKIEVPTPKDYSEAREYFNSHYWNQLLMDDIVGKCFPELKVIRVEGLLVDDKESKRKGKNKLKRKFGFFCDKLVSFIPQNPQILLYHSYFPIGSLLALNLKLGQIPRIFHDFEKSFDLLLYDQGLRSEYSLEKKVNSPFLKYIYSSIFKHMPICYIEGFCYLIDAAKQIKYQPKVIVTATGHITNDFFKIWSALTCSSGSAKLVISSHGGSLPSLMGEMKHPEKISYKYAVWTKPYSENHIQMPAQKLFGRLTSSLNGDGFCTIIGLELAIYSDRCQSGPISSLILKDFAQKENFINYLGDDVFNKLKIKAYPDRGWDLRNKYLRLVGEEKIDNSSSIIKTFEKSKLVVCTYPQTTFLEAIYSGKPSMLLYLEKAWELEPEFEEVISVLKSVGIVHHCEKEAAEHVNKIWDNPLDWWHLDTTVQARKMFLHSCGGRQWNDPIGEWARFLGTI